MMDTPAEMHLAAGEFHFGAGRIRVHTTLGTCVAIAVWHPIQRMGGICHFLLPTRPSRPAAATHPGFYADEVMSLFAAAMHANQTGPGEYIVKVAGGGHMFPDQLFDTPCRDGACTEVRRVACPSIGCKNLCAARSLLNDAGYVVTAEDAGGCGSRQVIFDLWSGEIWVKRGLPMSSIAGRAA